MKKEIYEIVSNILSQDDFWKTLLMKLDNDVISKEERYKICYILTDEFSIRGTDENYEPTPYWLLIEEAIDEINRPNFK